MCDGDWAGSGNEAISTQLAMGRRVGEQDYNNVTEQALYVPDKGFVYQGQ